MHGYILTWKSILEIVILWISIYSILLFLKGTNAAYVLRGIFVLICLLFVFRILGLPVLTKLLTYFFGVFLILAVIIFQSELREALIRLGKRHFFYIEHKKEDIKKALEDIVSAVEILAKKKHGVLIAIKREISLKNFIESGVILNADLTVELLQNIFYPLTPLHDGGVIIDGRKILAASCLFPLSDNPNLSKTLGTRHRSAIGLSEHTDAIVIVVSEENGTISLAINGQLTGSLSVNELLTILHGQLIKK